MALFTELATAKGVPGCTDITRESSRTDNSSLSSVQPKKNINKKRCVMFSAGEVPLHRCSGDGKYLELSRILVQFVVNEKKK